MKIQPLYVSALTLFMSSLLVSPLELSAQNHESIEVAPTNGNGSGVIHNKSYRYPEFIEGKVTFKNGTTTTANLNYNVFSGEVEFVKGKDTLAVDNLFTIASISIGDDLYFYDEDSKSLLQQLEKYKSAKLLVKEKYEVADIKSKGALGSTPSSIAATSATQYTDKSQTYNLKSADNYKFKVKTSYYLADLNDHYYEASKRNIFKLYPHAKSAANQYIKANKVNFENQDELRALIQYIESLKN
ncbi:hypothetical protein [Pontibacter mangrovi]|uniref:DUF4369 domain-containing protein n=1 Tax=Pontibacter mangrovi TaxID=2589816 RepID=A0A501W4I4_9BACT|nr:hypothetical protein [Pontibacter mangrovi]TPE42161.1 hypothetical protein FJM65_18955 [Pontibacter mangrovi]